jgi:hypothetical protein
MESESKKLAMPTAALRLSIDEAGVFTGRLREFAVLAEIGSKSATMPAAMLDANNNTHSCIAVKDEIAKFQCGWYRQDPGGRLKHEKEVQ